MSSIPEREVHQSSVACQVFPEATPTANVSEYEANVAEDNTTASAEEKQAEECVATPPITEEVVPDVNMSIPIPPTPQVETENPEAATTNTNEATDTVMAEANMEPSPTQAPEVSEATDPTASVPAPATGPQFDYHIEHRPQV